MKIKILLILIFVFQFSYGQTDSLEFKESTFIRGISYRTNIKTYPKPNKSIDLYFFKKHYNQFNYLPNQLTNKDLSNQIVEKWAYEDRPKDWNSNWTNTYEYDSNGKLTSYSYSGCAICSQFNYRYELIYNKNNRIVEQIDIGIDGIINGNILLEYDEVGNLIKLEKYGQNKKTIKLIIEKIK